MNTKHTPGPWTVWSDEAGRPIGQIYTETGQAIAIVARENDETLANAHLISAAPDLLEACKGALMQANITLDLESPESGKRAALQGLSNQLRAAIAKAGGTI